LLRVSCSYEARVRPRWYNFDYDVKAILFICEK
jgi:hypothetical protein